MRILGVLQSSEAMVKMANRISYYFLTYSKLISTLKTLN